MRILFPLIFLVGCGSPAVGAAADAPAEPAGSSGSPVDALNEAASAEGSGISLGFVLTRSEALDADALIAAAGALGVSLAPSEAGKDAVGAFAIDGGGHLMVGRMPAPHPDAPHMPVSPLTPDAEAVARAQAHFIVTGFALPGTLQERDALMARLLAAVVGACEAEGVMLGHGILFYKPALFADIVANTEPGLLPVEICVDLTMAPEGPERMSFLTHGMQRYGREEFYVTARRDGSDALEFTWMMSRWMIYDPDKQLPTGDTVGRTPEEKMTVQRAPSPTGEGPEVIRLDMP